MPRRLAAFLLLTLACNQAPALTFKARVVKIADGDSLTVRDASGKTLEVRISGIDAPEGRQSFGPNARASLEALLKGRDVTIDVDDVDRYGRLVARVSRESRDAGLAQLEAGMAWTYPWAEGLGIAEKKRYADAESKAKAAKRGLWRESTALAPWVFRRDAKSPAPPASVKPAGPVIGNRNSKLYHLPGCPGYNATSERNRVRFANAAEAETAGYRRAGNCS